MKAIYSICVLCMALLSISVPMGDMLVEQTYPGNAAVEWANGTIDASASGYNDGSVMNEGRHWSTADNFTLPGTAQWGIDSLSFTCGTDLNAQVSTYRISIFADDSGQPESWTNPLLRYEEDAASLNRFTVNSSLAGGTKDRYIQDITLDTSSLGWLLDGGMTYYVSIEGDADNPQDIYNGFDTYYQRFYVLLNDSGQNSYTGQYDTGWTDWQSQPGDFIMAIEGTEIPEPTTLLLVGLGGLLIRRKK